MYSYSDGTKPVQVHCEEAFLLMVLFYLNMSVIAIAGTDASTIMRFIIVVSQ